MFGDEMVMTALRYNALNPSIYFFFHIVSSLSSYSFHLLIFLQIKDNECRIINSFLWRISQLFNLLVSQLFNLLVSQLFNLLVSQLFNLLVSQLFNLLVSQLFIWLISQLFILLITKLDWDILNIISKCLFLFLLMTLSKD